MLNIITKYMPKSTNILKQIIKLLNDIRNRTRRWMEWSYIFIYIIKDKQPSSVSYSPLLLVITGFIITKSYNPPDVQIIALLYPIIFAASPTHLSLLAFNVSSKSFAIYLSFSVDF